MDGRRRDAGPVAMAEAPEERGAPGARGGGEVAGDGAPRVWRTRGFEAPRWLKGGHLQTVVPSLLRRPPVRESTRHRLDTEDGDFLDVDVAEPDLDGAPALGLCLVVHGLEGSSRSPYVLGTMDMLLRRRIVAVALNQRGCSGEPNRVATSYHSGHTRDIAFVLDWAAKRYPDLAQCVVGFSLGANQTLKWLGESGDALPARVLGGCGISPPFDLHQVAGALDSVWGVVYRAHFLKTLVPKALAKARRFPDAIDARRVWRGARKLRDYDHAVTAPVHGYASAEDYYDRASCGRYLDGIRRPTLILTSTDDPIIPGRSIPRERVAANPAIEMCAAERGGHVGFVYGPVARPRFWAEEQAALWVARRLSEQGPARV